MLERRVRAGLQTHFGQIEMANTNQTCDNPRKCFGLRSPESLGGQAPSPIKNRQAINPWQLSRRRQQKCLYNHHLRKLPLCQETSAHEGCSSRTAGGGLHCIDCDLNAQSLPPPSNPVPSAKQKEYLCGGLYLRQRNEAASSH